MHHELQQVEQHIKKYKKLLTQNFSDLSDLATMFALSFKEVSTVLVGIDLLEYLHKSLKAANGKYFEPVTLASAQKLEYPDPAFLDLRKWDKQGWLN